MAEQSELVHVRNGRLLPSRADTESLIEELERNVRGEVRFDTASRGLYARDASNFRMIPIGVVIPKDAQDVVATVAACSKRGVPVLSRGGGTSLAGQCCNTAVVMDFTRYMDEVLQIMPEQKLARVKPGTILDHLRDEASKHGLTFGPDPATHDHCALGGMIGNNSCGIHAVQAEFYGPGARVQDNVHDLEILTYDGLRIRVGETSEEELEAIIRAGGREGEIYGKLRDLRDRYAGQIRERFPDIPRLVSGYSLPALLPENGFHVAQALVGSEGTCVTVLEATVKLIPELPRRALVCVGFEDVFQAGDAIPIVRRLKHKPIGCEGLDHNLVRDIEKKGLHEQYIPLLPKGDGYLIIQFGADDQEEADAMAQECVEALRKKCVDYVIYDSEEDRHGLWQVRESGLGATAFVPGQHDTWPGWEDSAVPPDRVGDYLRNFHALLGRYGYEEAALYGHFAQGCIHTRIPFHLTTEDGLREYKRFTRQAAELCMRYGGSLSGEHGDGQQRGDLLPIMFGDELMQAFREFKAIWDPQNRMNPGKLIDAYPRDTNLALGADYAPWNPETHFPFAEDEGRIAHAALRCVGVGKCRRDEGGVMCPSWMALREEMHTTRGRAHLFFEMFQGDVVTDGWKSEEVKEALDLCLACKGCTGDCPVNVDIPTLKAEFLSHYYEGRLRPRHAYAFGLIHRWARVGALVPELANFVTQTPGLSRLAKWMADVAPEREIPAFAKETFRSWFQREWSQKDGDGRRVLLWPDTFNNHFFPDTLAAAAEALADAGCHVVIPPEVLCCGRPLYDYGMMETAKSLWQKTLATLREEIEAGTPLIGLEPSCTAAFEDELRKLHPHDDLAQKLCAQTHTLSGFLMDELEGYQPPKLEGRKAIVHYHCQHKGVIGEDCEEEMLEKMGLETEVPQETCCGLAGSFGFERDHYDLSMQIGELKLLPAVREASSETYLVADGFSCREQVRHGTGRQPLHSAELLKLARDLGRVEPVESRRPDAIARSGVSTGVKVLVGGALLGAGALAAFRLMRG